MLADIPLVLQTAYAELLERAATMGGVAIDGVDEGAFTAKTVGGRRYWYFREARTRRERYVGTETPDLLDRIERHRLARDELRERRRLVAALVRSAVLPRPDPEIGEALRALAAAGFFGEKGAVLVGTVAFQTYSAMLGTRLPGSSVQTSDVDLGAERGAILAAPDPVSSPLAVLKQADDRFRPVPHHRAASRSVAYTNGRVRVDFLVPNRGPDSDAPVRVPGLGVDAQPLRFLDFLIGETVAAIVLHGPGIAVRVPLPERYAVHKLIVARRRQVGSAKIEKDLRQAAMLLQLLARKRPFELRAAWEESSGRGRKRRQHVEEALMLLGPEAQATVRRVTSG